MKNNRFFVINHALSEITSNLVFNYTRIVLNSPRNIESILDSYPYYPFYLSFKPYRIDFNYLGPYPQDSLKRDDDNWEIEHTTIFSLPLSFDYSVNDHLTTKLIELYDEESRFDKCYTFNSVHDFNCDMNSKDDIHIYSYNNLSIFDNKSILPFKTDNTHRISHRIIFLDFLFDFNEIAQKHNDFSYCPYFDEIKTRLLQNDFFNALASKYSYYYNHQRILELNDKKKGINKIHAFQKDLNRLLQVTNDIDFIRKINECLPDFSPITSFEEKGIKKLLKQHKFNLDFKYFITFLRDKTWKDEHNKENLLNEFFSEYKLKLIKENARVNYELKKYAEVKDNWIKILEKEGSTSYILPEKKWWKHFEIELENIFFQKDTLSKQISLENDEWNRIEAAKWFCNRYDVLKSFLLVLKHPFGKRKHTQTSINTQTLLMVSVYLAIVSGISLIIYLNGERNISTAILYFSFSNIGLILISTIFFFIMGIINLMIHKKSNHYKLSIRTAGFFLPRLLMAIISGWLFLAIAGEELWKFELDLHFNNILHISVGLLILMFLFLYLEIWKINPKSWKSAINRVITMIYIGLMYSFIVGFFITIFTSQKIIKRSDLLEKFTYNVLASSEMKKSNRDSIHAENYPQHFDTTLKFNSLANFRHWISDSIYYESFINDSLLVLRHIKWNEVFNEQFEIIDNLKKIRINKPDKNMLDRLSIYSLKHTSEDSIISFINKNITTKTGDDTIKSKIAKSFIKLTKIRQEAFHEINNSLIAFSYTKPLLDDQLITDFLTHVKHNDDYVEIYLVEKVFLPFNTYKKTDKADFIIFPGYLILNSFLALFVGVFLQMIFDKKNMAEPL